MFPVVVNTYPALLRLDQRFSEEPQRRLHVEEVPGVEYTSDAGPVEPRGVAFAGQRHTVTGRGRHFAPYGAGVVIERLPIIHGKILDHWMIGGLVETVHTAPE